MGTLFLAFFAGILTVAAPCILPLLPVVVGGSLLGKEHSGHRQWIRPIIITVSLALSIITFSLLLKATTTLLDVPQEVWQTISGGIVLLLGVHFLWPKGWELLAGKTGLFSKSNKALGNAHLRGGYGGAILIGAALGPVFNSCSPTYALIVATILPVSFAQGLAYLIAYAIGLSAALLAIAFAGQSVASKLSRLGNPSGWLKRSTGIIFIIVGLSVAFGLDKRAQTFILDKGWYNPISSLEENLR